MKFEKIKKVKNVPRILRAAASSAARSVTRHPYKAGALALVFVMAATGATLWFTRPTGNYNLAGARTLLDQPDAIVSKGITYNEKSHVYEFDTAKQQATLTKSTSGIGGVTVTAATDPNKGVSVTDSTNGYSLALTAKYALFDAKRIEDKIIYPMRDGTGWNVYTVSKSGVKEDIVLQKYTADSQTYSFDLGLGPNLTARVESDGGIGVYGNSLLGSNVTAATDTDSALLKKARANAPKDTLMFRIPKPVIYEQGKKQSEASAVYSLEGNTLKVIASHLSHATFPLTIDPSIYVVTAQQFMNGNNESNIDFDIANKLIKKTHTTGARFDTWNQTTGLPSPSWGAGSAAAGGFIYSVGGTSLNGQVFNTQGSASLTIPAGVTSITVKSWGGGGGSGGSGSSGTGGTGGGAGFVGATLTVTPGETLTAYVGGGGKGGTLNTAGGGGGGGGYTSLYRGSTPLTIAPGGGGGGGSNGTNNGGSGGAGGTGSGNGTSSGAAGGGGSGTASAGGTGGTGGNNPGASGASLSGGDGGDGRTATGADGSGVLGGLLGGGNGGAAISTARAGGGAGGGGYFGGGGGSGSTNASGGGGGGGGYYYYDPAATSVNAYTGNQALPGGSGDANRSGAGNGAAISSLGNAGNQGSTGLLYITFGSGGTVVGQSVSWAQFDQSSASIVSADPGSGTCTGWCTTSAYNLPAPRTATALITYNGYLYALGGSDGSGNGQKTVYIAKLGANGEPQLWNPTSTDKSTWTYWYTDTTLTTNQSVFSAYAYNNRMYIVGGRAGSTSYNNSYYASINPNGTLGSMTSTTALPVTLWGGNVQIYNDYMYYIGGATTVGGTPGTSVYYSKINSDGSLNSWSATSSFSNGRMSESGDFTSILGAYIYISSGCTATNGNGGCTAAASDTQLASINADGSLDSWGTIGNVSNTVSGASFLAWRNNLYAIGGCSSPSSSGGCDSLTSTIRYGTINDEGDASTVAQSVAAGTAPCSGGSPTNCNLPGTTYIGNMLSAAIITNGYLYVIGGCTNNACDTTTGNVAYTAIGVNGAMSKPATCPNGSYQGNQWCVDTTNTVSGGIAATSPVVFNNRIYLVGGLNGNANTNTIVRTTVNTNGSIGAWTSQSMTGAGAANVSYLYSYVRANPASAGTNPGNLYVFGGCATSSAAGCTAYSQTVSKCNIATNGAVAGCTATGQLQIGTIPGDTATGLGIMSGTVYANYVYLIGGVSPNVVDLPSVRYAKFDNNNNVVAASGTTWTQAANQMGTGRRRAAAFGYNGYLYAVGGYDGTSGSVLADIEFIKINVSDGSLGSATEGFKVSTVKINQRWGLTVPVSNSFAYVIGGCVSGASPSGCTARTDVIQTFQIYNNNDGAPAGYSTTSTWSNTPNRFGHSSTILNNYIYVAGGCTGTVDCTNATNDVSYAPIDANGTVGTWASATNVLPAIRGWGKLVTVGGTLYYVGGQSSSGTDQRTEVYYATPAANGNITSAWATATNGLPQTRSKFGVAVWNRRIYVVGGQSNTTNCPNVGCSTVYVSPQLTGGNISSAWSTSSTQFAKARYHGTAVAYANNLYLLGGFDDSNFLSDTQYASIDPTTGNVGAWTYSESLPVPIAGMDSFAANGYIYLVGGKSAYETACSQNTYVAPISANTTIASGNKPTGIGAWFATNQRYSDGRYGPSASYANGKAYVLGGACGLTTSLSYPTIVSQQTTLLSQPQIAKYSIAFDTDTEVTPSNWLVNGLDNAIGASWQLKYRSMTDNASTACTSPAMTTWGQETNFGSIVLGLPGVYTPKNASGATTNCARYYYMNLTVDSSQAFGYPDDVSRGPTISDITLQFTADPSKRLMHGRTYTGGLQQPVDTPYYTQ